MSEAKTKIVKGMVESDVRLDGKTVVITGCNTGIGYETVLDLAARGAKIIMACRNIEKAEIAKEKYRLDVTKELVEESIVSVQSYIGGESMTICVNFMDSEIKLSSFPRQKVREQVKDADLVITKLDLSSLDSVRKCAKNINEVVSRIDILINNAGVMMCPAWKTKDGFEMQLGTNHIGHFLFTNLLLDLVKKSAPSRIVIVSSIAYKSGRLNWDDVVHEKKYDAFAAYRASKLANVFHCTELSRRLEGTGVTCNVLHPGVINSELKRHLEDGSHLPWHYRVGITLLSPFARFLFLTPKRGAQTTLYCAIAPELKNVSGKYFANCEEEPLQNHAKKLEDAERLWKMSEEWTKEKTV